MKLMIWDLIKHLVSEAKKFLWENFKTHKAEKLAAERFKFDAKLIDALVQKAEKGVLVTVRDKDGVVYTFTAIPKNEQVIQTQSSPYF
ncbi:MAG TPA: hypothetical protein VMD05_05650 [Candidatus Nanoarchaeia archaeon]|nr:hypothetical protein [Candidatus Nanoarchaeia archaeon]